MPKFSKHKQAQGHASKNPMRGFCARTAASTTVSTTEGSFTSTTITTSTSNKLAKGVDDDSDEEMEPATASELPNRVTNQSLSQDQEDELDALAEERDGVAERLQSLESNLETLDAAERDMKMELDQLDDLEQHDPEGAARSRALLADEIRNDHIGEDRAAVSEAIRSAEAEDQDLDEAMQAVYAGGSDGDGEPGDGHDDDDGPSFSQ